MNATSIWIAASSPAWSHNPSSFVFYCSTQISDSGILTSVDTWHNSVSTRPSTTSSDTSRIPYLCSSALAINMIFSFVSFITFGWPFFSSVALAAVLQLSGWKILGCVFGCCIRLAYLRGDRKCRQGSFFWCF